MPAITWGTSMRRLHRRPIRVSIDLGRPGPATGRHTARPAGDRHIREGDLVVTAMADHHAVGRITADGRTHVSLGSEQTRAAALDLACALAGTAHRVFLHPSAGTNTYSLVDCANRSR